MATPTRRKSATTPAKNAPLELHPKLTALPHPMAGPYAHRPGGGIITVDDRHLLTTRNAGRSWSHRPLFQYKPSDKEFKLSSERILLRTKADTLVLSFMNINEKRWLWRDELRDALPGTRIPQYVMRSTDGGQTWQDITLLHEDWTGDIRNAIQTRSGRIVISSMKMIHDPGHHGVITYYSDDDGVTWRHSNLIDLGGAGHHGGAIEATIEQLRDGRLWMLLRTNWGCLWQSFSHDEGASWREFGPTTFEATGSPALLKRLRDGRLILLWNRPAPPDRQRPEHIRGGDGIWSEVPTSVFREDLSAALSSDDGHTWSEPIVLARRVGAWVSYPRLFEQKPGVWWVSTMQGGLCATFREKDFT